MTPNPATKPASPEILQKSPWNYYRNWAVKHVPTGDSFRLVHVIGDTVTVWWNEVRDFPASEVQCVATGKMLNERPRGFVDLNINATVRVKLTRPGIHRYYQYFEEVGMISEGPKIDEDGWVEMQLWSVMAIFGGPRMHLGCEDLIETTIQIPIPAQP